jgi:NAD(P)-dependent dehydrogenase (short-subunit alcohol dehydrogenase family)
MRLENRVAVVTGSARGIGAGIARVFAAEGAKVVVADLDLEQGEKTAAELGNGSVAMRVDMIEESAVEALAAKAREQFGGLDIWVNNAGATRTPIGQSTEQYLDRMATLTQRGWDEQLATNLRTTFLGTKAAAPLLIARGGGSIVNIASIAGIMPSPTLPAYAAAKAGVISFTRSSALELAQNNIRVNAILPGFLWTRVWEQMTGIMRENNPALANMELHDIFLDAVKRGVPLGREQTPEDIGKLAAFLSSEEAANITGQAIAVDGGITLR